MNGEWGDEGDEGEELITNDKWEHPNFAKKHRTGTKTLYKPFSLASLAPWRFVISLLA
jgi:hypothetical protein